MAAIKWDRRGRKHLPAELPCATPLLEARSSLVTLTRCPVDMAFILY